MPELAYVNGIIGPIEEAVVPIEDRGYNFGDAVYEYVATYNGRLFRLEEHLERLSRSMAALSFPPVSIDEVRRAIVETHRASGIERAGIYLQISRGVDRRDHPFPAEPVPQVVMTVRQLKEKPEAYRQDGIGVITVTDFRWGRCDIKTVQLLPNVLAKQQALDAGAFDAVFVAEDGVVREATSSNFYIVSGGRLITHPLTERILAGITRLVLLRLAPEIGIPVEERFFTVDEMMAADEAFLTGTTTEVLPVVTVDGAPIGNGKPGPNSRKLFEALRKEAGG
jgi:D-alanine transaminase